MHNGAFQHSAMISCTVDSSNVGDGVLNAGDAGDAAMHAVAQRSAAFLSSACHMPQNPTCCYTGEMGQTGALPNSHELTEALC